LNNGSVSYEYFRKNSKEDLGQLPSFQENRLFQITHQYIIKKKYFNTSTEKFIYTSGGKLKGKITKHFEEAWSNYLRYQYYFSSEYLLTDEKLT